MKIDRLTSIVLSSLTLILSGIFTLLNFSEWFIVNVKGEVADYPFGGEGPTPYYYQNAELYSTIILIWGSIFLTVFVLATWTIINRKKKLTLFSLAVTLFLILGLFIHGQIIRG